MELVEQRDGDRKSRKNMREFLGYCEFSNGWIAIDIDEGHSRFACLFAFLSGEEITRN